MEKKTEERVEKKIESKKSGMTLSLTSIDDKGVETTDTFDVGDAPAFFAAQGKTIRINNV